MRNWLVTVERADGRRLTIAVKAAGIIGAILAAQSKFATDLTDGERFTTDEIQQVTEIWCRRVC